MCGDVGVIMAVVGGDDYCSGIKWRCEGGRKTGVDMQCRWRSRKVVGEGGRSMPGCWAQGSLRDACDFVEPARSAATRRWVEKKQKNQITVNCGMEEKVNTERGSQSRGAAPPPPLHLPHLPSSPTPAPLGFGGEAGGMLGWGVCCVQERDK